MKKYYKAHCIFVNLTPQRNSINLKPTDNTPFWYAFYTLPRAEKKVAEKLEKHKFEYYLPLIKTLKQWSDRKKMVIEPIFKSYIFVKVLPDEIKRVLPIDGILKIISFGHIPQSIPDSQVAFLKLLLESPDEIEISSTLQTGDKVRIIQGPLAGAEGFLGAIGSKNFKINIEIVGHSIAVAVNPAYLEKIAG